MKESLGFLHTSVDRGVDGRMRRLACFENFGGNIMLGGKRVIGGLVVGLATLLTVCAVPTVAVTPALASGPAVGATYVALGDSYSSGEGLGQFQAGTDTSTGTKKNTCHRSESYAYPDLSPTIVLPEVKSRAFWACSGATTIDMSNVPGASNTPKEYGQPEQVATVGSATKYISVTVGGDDLGFSGIGLACTTLEVGNQVIRLSKTSCSNQLKASEGGIPALQTRLTNLYMELLSQAAEGAELVVAGYPRVLPSSFKGVGKFEGQPFCTFDYFKGVGDIGMVEANAKKVATFETNLNTAIQKAVSAASEEFPGRVKYSNIYPTSVPRNCAGTTPNATVTGFELSPGRHGTGPYHLISTATFHPTKVGQKVYAKAIENTFRSFK